MLVRLEKCPYCGGDGELYVYEVHKGKRLYLVRCEECGNGTCADNDISTVIKLWNTRAESSPEESPEDEEEVITIYISLPTDMDKDEKYAKQKRLSESASDYLNAMVELKEAYPDECSAALETIAARLKIIGEADYVIFPEGWELEGESRIEYTVAKEYGKKILIEHGDKIQEEV